MGWRNKRFAGLWMIASSLRDRRIFLLFYLSFLFCISFFVKKKKKKKTYTLIAS